MSYPNRPASAPFLPPLGLQGVSLRILLLFVQLVFLLFAITNSPIFGGGWSIWTPEFEFYLLLFGVAVIIEGVFLPSGTALKPKFQATLPEDLKPGATAHFLFWFGAFLMGGIAIGGLLLGALHIQATTTLSGQYRITEIAYLIIFVAPTEEFLFRVVLPPRAGILLGSVVLFALFHLGDYTAQTGGFTSQTISQLIFAAVLGLILYYIYDFRDSKGERMFGYGGCTAVHAAWDLLFLGAVGGFTIGVGSVPFTVIAHVMGGIHGYL